MQLYTFAYHPDSTFISYYLVLMSPLFLLNIYHLSLHHSSSCDFWLYEADL